MNCRDFDIVVNELADGRLMEAATREAGLGHAGECLPCAARLMDARGVGAALRVAARAETVEAPARVKQALLAAFAERLQESMETAAVEPPPAVVVLPSRRALRRWDAAAVAAAAAVLLILGVTYVMRDSRRASQAPPSEMRAALPAPTAPAASEEKNAAPASTEVVARDTSTNSTKRATAPARKAPRLTNAAKSKSETAARNFTRNAKRSGGNEYLPLTYLAGATAMESGTVVRVELSRSALISLGVPVGVERSDELLKADVVIGDDGVARAIRLVGND